MANYNRVTVWVTGQNLTAADLNNEFDAIRAIINGGLDASNFSSLLAVQSTFCINAGDARFQTGGLSNAELVAAAVAEAVAGDIKLVYIPRTMFGYVEDAEYGTISLNASVMRIREGQMGAGHDPVAYGAKPGDASADDQPAFRAARIAAENSAIGLNPGGGWVEVTMKGEYQLDSDVTLGSTIGFIEYPGVTYAGSGAITSPDVDDSDKNGLIAYEGLRHRIYTDSEDQVVGASSSEQVVFTISDYPSDEYIMLHWSLHVEQDSGNSNVPIVNLSEGVTLSGVTGDFDLDVDVVRAGTGGVVIAITMTNTDGGNPHTANLELVAYFIQISNAA